MPAGAHGVCRVFVAAMLALAAVPADAADAIQGAAPRYAGGRALSTVPNAQAVRPRFWVPDLDEGWTPQGLALVGDTVWLGLYRDGSPASCRLVAVAMASGQPLRRVDGPPACRHAGGLAYDGAETLYLADTRVVFALDARTGALRRQWPLDGEVAGSFATFHAGRLWLGRYRRDAPAQMFAFAPETLAARVRLGPADAAAARPVPAGGQGAAFDGQGRLWVARSGSRYGELQRIDAAGGAEARHGMPDGLEGISFDGSGQLWGVSEAGARKYQGWRTFFPVAMTIDLGALR